MRTLAAKVKVELNRQNRIIKPLSLNEMITKPLQLSKCLNLNSFSAAGRQNLSRKAKKAFTQQVSLSK